MQQTIRRASILGVGVIAVFVTVSVMTWLLGNIGLPKRAPAVTDGFPGGISEEVKMKNSLGTPARDDMTNAVLNEARSFAQVSGPLPDESAGQAQSVAEKHIVRNAALSIRVGNADEAIIKIRGVAQWHKGDVYSSSVTNGRSGARSGYITVKVPTENFDAAMAGIREVATIVVDESVSNEDITATVADLEARLKNKRAEEAAFLAILDRSGKMDDVIAATTEVSRVRGEIEVLEAQQRYNESQTAMASITVSLSEDQHVALEETWRPWQKVKDAASGFLHALQGFVDGGIIFVIFFVPMAILYGIVVFFLWIIVRRVWKKISR